MRFCALVLASAVALAPRPATAATSARLVYTRSPQAAACPDQAALRSAVASRIGYDPFVVMARTTVVAEINHGPDAFVAHVLLVDEAGVTRGRRDLSSSAATCDATFEALALAISIALDAEAATDSAPPRSPTAPPPEPTQAPPPQPPPPPPPPVGGGDTKPTAAPSPPAWSTSAAAVLAFGIAPSASTGAMVSLDGRLGRLAFGVDGRALLKSSGDRTAASLLGGGASLCAVFEPAQMCAVGILGTLEASGSAIAAPRSDAALFEAFGARAAADVPMNGWLALRFGVEAFYNAHRATLMVDGVDAWTAPPFAFTSLAGLVVRNP